jgi:type II secretory pathway pseudopilin PulG
VTISTRVREESGLGLIELLIAMTVMVVGITAIVAAMSSGFVAVKRASDKSTAAAVADKQMEGYRKVRFASVTPTCSPSSASSADCFVNDTVTGPDGRSYRIDSGIKWECGVGTLGGTVASPTCTPAGTPPIATRPAKLVTVIVFDLSTTPAKELFRESSTFDQATG